MKKKELLMGVKVISILAYIIGGVNILAGLWFVLGIGFLQDTMERFFANYFSGFGVVLIILGLVILYIGRNLWNGKNWARRTILVLVTLSLLGNLTSFSITGWKILSILVDIGIIAYLLNKKVKKEFS